MPDAGWVPVANTAARDWRITWKARGLLAELLSYPDGWETSVDKLVEMAENSGGDIEGRDAMRKAMNELIRVGYVQRTRCREGGRWVTKLAVSDAPTVTDYPASVEPAPVQPASVDQALLRTRTTNTVLTETDHGYSTSLDTLAAATATQTQADLQQRLLDKIYGVVDGFDADQQRRHLLIVERKRPKIYREARNAAIDQVKRDNPKRLVGEFAAQEIDPLSYKWIILHYVRESGEVPIWLARPMGLVD